MNDQEAPKIGRYLLGELPPEEMDALEARLLTESGLFDLAESVEDEVIDRYVRGELSAAEARRFERRLLPSERIQERVAFARALADPGAKKPSHRRSTDRPKAPVVPLFRSPVRLAWAATLVACLLAGALGFEVFQLRNHAGELERTRAATVARLEVARQQAASAPARTEEAPARDEEADRISGELSAARDRIAELEAREATQAKRRVRQPDTVRDDIASASFFIPLPTRAGGGPETLDLGDAERVELQLDLGGQRPEGPVVATVLRAGQPVYREPEVPVEALDGESMARLEMPRQSLLEGRYRIELAEGETGAVDHLLGTYEISVVR